MKPRAVRRSASGENGFTLVEAIIAMVVFIIGVIGIANLFMVAASHTYVANCMSASTAEASQTMDDLKATAFDTLVPGGDLGNDDAGYHAYTTVSGVVQIRTRWTIEQMNAAPPMYFITVHSEPMGRLGGSRARAIFSTFRTRNP